MGSDYLFSSENSIWVSVEDEIRNHRLTDISYDMTTPMINEFIEKILVHAPEKVDGDRDRKSVV